MPVQINLVSDGLKLNFAKRWAGFDKMHRCAGEVGHQHRPDVPHVAHQCSASWPKFKNRGVARLPRNLIHMGEIKAAHLAEQPRNFRRGGEVAITAERVPCRVIAGLLIAKAYRHVILDADGAGLGNAGPNGILEPVFRPFRHWRRRFRMMKPPAATIGRHRSWPMVAKPIRMPSCGSG